MTVVKTESANDDVVVTGGLSTLKIVTFYYATIAYHVGLNADLGLPHPGPTS